MNFPKSELWNYSSQIWDLGNVEAVCLSMQNELQINVNMLLYCCWIGDQKRCINDDDIQALLDSIKPWQAMIDPLRDSRKMMQQQLIAMPSHLIDQTIANISEMELNAEHMQQLSMEKTISLDKLSSCDERSELECSLNNLHHYIQSIDNIDAGGAMSQLSQLLTAIYDDEEAVQLAMMSQTA